MLLKVNRYQLVNCFSEEIPIYLDPPFPDQHVLVRVDANLHMYQPPT